MSFTPQGWHESPIAGKVHYQSSYEHKFMIWLDEHNVNWEKCKEKFPYIKSDGKKHNYNPDIYLPDYDLYLEVKGMVRKNDPAKFEAFPEDKKLCLLGYDELSRLGLHVFNPFEIKTPVDKTKWPYKILNQIDDYEAVGELSEALKEKVSSDKFFEMLKKNKQLN